MIRTSGCCCAGCLRDNNWQVCGEASNGVEAIEGVEQFAPDIVVMDLAMPVMSGLQAAPEIIRTHPKLPMLLISVQEVSRQLAWEARNAGYRGAVTKSGGDEILKGIEALLRHDMFFYKMTDLPVRPRASPKL
jgi:DNA-binding NarL/FixJ family response regulator